MLIPAPFSSKISYNKTQNPRCESETHCHLLVTNNFNNGIRLTTLKIHSLFYFPDNEVCQDLGHITFSRVSETFYLLESFYALWSKRGT